MNDLLTSYAEGVMQNIEYLKKRERGRVGKTDNGAMILKVVNCVVTTFVKSTVSAAQPFGKFPTPFSRMF